MKQTISSIIITISLSFTATDACTTMIITKGASADGSMIVAHSDDSEMFDNRLVYVPAADYKAGEVRPVYYDPASLGNRAKYNSSLLRRYVGRHRGPVYVDKTHSQSVALGYIPSFTYLCLYGW
jgi:hypothetical protein